MRVFLVTRRAMGFVDFFVPFLPVFKEKRYEWEKYEPSIDQYDKRQRGGDPRSPEQDAFVPIGFDMLRETEPRK